MKRILLLITLFIPFDFIAQTVTLYTEDFGSGCNADFQVTSYNPPTGAWTVTNTGSNVATANIWYVSAAENGNAAGQCGSGCGNDRTLHIGSDPTIMGDIGAAYFEGLSGFCGIFGCGATDKRVESPTVNCNGYTNIQLSFLYLEGGNVADNATLWYYNGTTWSQLTDLAKTVGACSPQGTWTLYSTNLPASAENNPNVKIGFRWVNNDNGVASDPSIAVDDIVITGDQDVADVTPPSIECPTELVLTCGLIPDFSGDIFVTDDIDPTPVVSQDPAAGTTYTETLTEIEFTATDASGNTSFCVVQINFSDVVSPMLICPNDVTVQANVGDDFAQIASGVIGNPIVSDDCGNVEISNNYPSDIFPVGNTIITWTAIDDSGNTSECQQTVTVEIDDAPVVVCPETQTMSCVALPDYTIDANVTDDNDPNPIVTQTPAAGTLVEGNMDVTITATDNAGNSTSCTFQVVFDDEEAPSIICPANLTVLADISGQAIITAEMLGDPVVSDNCGVQDVFNNVPFETFSEGITYVMWTVLDISGYGNTCTQTLIVAVDEPPLIACLGEITEYAVAPQCTPSWTYGCEDDAVDRVVIQAPNDEIIMDTGNEGCNGAINSWTENNTVVNLIQGYTYTITLEAFFGFMQYFGVWFDANNDGDFNGPGEFLGGSPSSTPSFTVTLLIPDYGNMIVQRRLRVISDFDHPSTASDYCLNSEWGEGEDFLLIMNSDEIVATCGVLPSYLDDVTVFDDFDPSPVIEQVPAPGTPITEDTEVVISATDSNGNTSSCSFVVTYADYISPSIVCPNAITANAADGLCSTDLMESTLGEAIVTDNCFIASVENNWSSETQYPVGISQIEWIAFDLSGNSSSCLQDITITDATDPIIICPEPMQVFVLEGEVSAYVNVVQPEIMEMCDYTYINDFNNTQDASGNYNLGVTEIVFTATDASGNIGSCVSSVEVSVQETICCLGDFNCDGFISVVDLIMLINEFGCLNGCATDLTNDGLVTTTDLMIFIGLYGGVCP